MCLYASVGWGEGYTLTAKSSTGNVHVFSNYFPGYFPAYLKSHGQHCDHCIHFSNLFDIYKLLHVKSLISFLFTSF